MPFFIFSSYYYSYFNFTLQSFLSSFTYTITFYYLSYYHYTAISSTIYSSKLYIFQFYFFYSYKSFVFFYLSNFIFLTSSYPPTISLFSYLLFYSINLSFYIPPSPSIYKHNLTIQQLNLTILAS